MTRFSLSRTAKLRANGLLNMLYKPSELADELGIEQRIIYRNLIPAGMPHERDEMGSIWLHGPMVAHWIRYMSRSRKVKLKSNEAYCLKCRSPVPLVRPKKVPTGDMIVLRAVCPNCGTTVNRGVKQ